MAVAATSIDKARQRRARATIRKSRVIKATSSLLEAGLDQYDGDFLLCRDLGHTWTVQGFFRYGGEIRRHLSCARCSSEATDVWSARGERIGRRYSYVDGYQIIGHGQVSRVDVRIETLNRVTIFNDEQSMMNALFRRGKKK